MRGLGATLNVFAIESFVDELAAEAGEDPVAYRLSILADTRARAVIERVAEMSGWRPGASGRHRQGPRHRLCAVQEPRRLCRRSY